MVFPLQGFIPAISFLSITTILSAPDLPRRAFFCRMENLPKPLMSTSSPRGRFLQDLEKTPYYLLTLLLPQPHMSLSVEG
jgi:hypothetical protein